MKAEIKQFIDMTIQLELNMSELYQFFYVKFPEDAQFWWSLSVEEINHASLIRTINDLIFPEGIIPSENLELQTEKIHEIIDSIHQKLEEYRRIKPLREEAFIYAYELKVPRAKSILNYL